MLPDLIEIIPLAAPVRAEVTVPGSKSITNRALILAALAEGETTLEGALWSEDTQVMVECLQELGFMVNVDADPVEFCNRTITVYGGGGRAPRGGTEQQPLELFVGNAGTAARFVAAMVCLGEGVYRLHGVPRMHERPQAGLFEALRRLGYRIDSPNDRLPALIHGGGPKAARCRVSIEQSSQFASALLLAATTGGWTVEIIGENAEESPYVEMTRQLCNVFPRPGGRFRIEPDASSGSYFLAAGDWQVDEQTDRTLPERSTRESAGSPSVKVANWPDSGWQVDADFPRFLSVIKPRGPAGMRTAAPEPSMEETLDHGRIRISRSRDLGDSIMTAMALAPLASQRIVFTELGRLRVQECERVVAMRTELAKCGGKVVERADTLEIFPSKLHGAEIETYQDHRMAMCFAILGLKVGGLRIKNPSCVKKTFPNFFQKLATLPPHGLGAEIRDAVTGQPLRAAALFAE